MLIVHMRQDWSSPPDARGDVRNYPKGWTGEMDDDAAGYCIARGIAHSPRPLEPGTEIGISVLREIIAQLEAARIEPTYRAVYDAVARIAADTPASSTVALPYAGPVPEPQPIPAAAVDAPVTRLDDGAADSDGDAPSPGDAAAAAQAAAAASIPRAPRRRSTRV